MQPNHEKRPAFATWLLGGTGREAGQHLRALHDSDGRPFPLSIIYIDTDPVEVSFVDRSILLPLDGDKVQTIQASPATFGPVAELIVKHYARFLHPEDISNGARTIRLLTQLAFAYYRESLLQELRSSLLDLLRQGGFERII